MFVFDFRHPRLRNVSGLAVSVESNFQSLHVNKKIESTRENFVIMPGSVAALAAAFAVLFTLLSSQVRVLLIIRRVAVGSIRVQNAEFPLSGSSGFE